MRKYYISLPNVDRNKVELSDEDIWIQIIKDLGNMVKINQKILERADDELKALIEKARVSALSDEEYRRYEAELKILSDEGTAERYGYDRGVLDGIKKGKAEGMTEGIAKGKAEGMAKGIEKGIEKGKVETYQKIITNLRRAGFTDESIADMTQIPIDEIRNY